MRVTLPVDESALAGFLPDAKPDGSGVGVNYADQVLKRLQQTLPDGRKLSARRKGLRLSVALGDQSGHAILRRLEHGPDVRNIFRRAFIDAAAQVGIVASFEDGAVQLEIP